MTFAVVQNVANEETATALLPLHRSYCIELGVANSISYVQTRLFFRSTGSLIPTTVSDYETKPLLSFFTPPLSGCDGNTQTHDTAPNGTHTRYAALGCPVAKGRGQARQARHRLFSSLQEVSEAFLVSDGVLNCFTNYRGCFNFFSQDSDIPIILLAAAAVGGPARLRCPPARGRGAVAR